MRLLNSVEKSPEDWTVSRTKPERKDKTLLLRGQVLWVLGGAGVLGIRFVFDNKHFSFSEFEVRTRG